MSSKVKPLQVLEAPDLLAYIGHTEYQNMIYEIAVFRGQARKGGLLPGIARRDPKRNTAELEAEALRQFKLMGASMLVGMDKSALEMLVVAQHYGLKTRLLDWTESPLAALFFACSSKTPGDAYVYMLEADTLLDKNVYAKNPFTLDKTVVFQPALNNPRIIAQGGWFTIHRYSKQTHEFVPLERNAEVASHLTEVIPEAKRESMLASLARHGMTSRNVWPDLEGLSQFLNRKLSL